MKKRVISAIILILIALPLIIEGKEPFALAIGLIGIFALKELIDLKKSHGPIPFIMTMIFYFGFLWIVFGSPLELMRNFGLNYTLIAFLGILFLFPTLFANYKERYTTQDAFYFLGAVLFLGIAFRTVIHIREKSLFYFLYIILIPILTDTFAYIFGSLIGKHKMIPHISPNKSWEGSILGSLLGTLVCSIFYLICIRSINWVTVASVTLLLSIAGQFGDLIFSRIKRENEIKDFSDLIPGHGGILDRFDSTIFVSLAFLLLMKFI